MRKIIVNAIHSQLGGVNIPSQTETTVIECAEGSLRIAVFHFHYESIEAQKNVLCDIVKSIQDNTGSPTIAIALRAGSTFELFEES